MKVLAMVVALMCSAVAVGRDASTRATTALSADKMCEQAGVSGGLCVLIGCHDAGPVVELARGGRYLVHVLEPDAAVVERLRGELQRQQLYGLASVEQLPADGTLPYTENLVNVVFAGEGACVYEINRVLTPGGTLFAYYKGTGTFSLPTMLRMVPGRKMSQSPAWQQFRKRWPKSMDGWTHPRHAADGNAVSMDSQVGPPRRIRWLAGPPQEVSNMVTAGGRAFFAGVLARDGFNGLRLWEQTLRPSPARGGFTFNGVPGAVQPIAAGDSLLVVSEGRLAALDAATGRELRRYPEAGRPAEVLLEAGTILAIDKDTVRALDLETARLRWKQSAHDARYTVAGDGLVAIVERDASGAASASLVCRQLDNGNLCWRRSQADLPWLPKVRRLVYHNGLFACEVSRLTDDRSGNAIHVLSAEDGKRLWGRDYVPLASHMKQARAMFSGDLLWILEGPQGKSHKHGCVGLDPRTGVVKKTLPASLTHCFPPVATCRYLFSGEMDFTDLASGTLDANQITKAACSRDAGVVPANGLLYTFPKHCVCWPMLRDYAALAPANVSGTGHHAGVVGVPFPPSGTRSVPDTIQHGPAAAPRDCPLEDESLDWPCYRHDAFRSGGTAAQLPRQLKILWTATLGGWPEGAIARDWHWNHFIPGPVGPPVAAGGLVYVTRPDAHQIAALDVQSGKLRWTFTANGRVDTAPTIHRGLCLFGSKSGWVYALRADDGRLVWRLRAAPADQRIVAYGQLESPWPVPGSVLVTDDVAYFAAGRQALADGGILVFAVEPANGHVRWVQRIDRVPQKDFYTGGALEFDAFDLLNREGDAVAMSRWLFDRATGKATCHERSGFTRLGTGGGGVFCSRGCWSYAATNVNEKWKERPLAAFRDNTLFSYTQDPRTLFRRDFHLADGEKFDAEWFAKWLPPNKKHDLWQSQRLARGAAWSVPLRPAGKEQSAVSAMLLGGDVLCTVSPKGILRLLDARDGATLSELPVPPPAWDGLASARGRLFLSTQDGRVLCLGE
jgi:outer membrane protein assembly factor BamB